MDNRKLKVKVSKNTVVHLHWDGPDPTNTKVASMALDKEDRDNAAEIVRRWNAHREQQNMLQRLAEKVRRANGIQHSGGKVDNEDWSELYGLSNEAFALLETLKD